MASRAGSSSLALARFAVARPRVVVAAFAAITLAVGSGLTRLRVETDGNALVPRDAPEVAVDARVRERFDLRDVIAVVVDAPGEHGIFETSTLAFVADATRTLERLEGLGAGEVTSLATEKSDRVLPGTFQFRSWLDPLPATREELERLRASLERVGILRGTLLANDTPSSATTILVRVPPNAERGDLVGAIRAAVDDCKARVPEAAARERIDVAIVGAPVVESLLGPHTLNELAKLLPLAAIVLSLVFLAAFRSLPALVIPMLEVTSAMLVVFGAMGYAGSPVYLTTAVLPVILAAVVVTDEIHVFTEFLARMRREPGASSATLATATLGELGGAVIATAVTTAIGFGACATSPLAPVRSFGVFMALGVTYCLFWSLVCVPALLALVPRSWWRVQRSPHDALAPSSIARALARVAVWSYDRRRIVVGVFAVLAVALPFVAARARVQDGWIAAFSPASPIRRATETVEKKFGGTHLLQIAVTAECVEARGSLASTAVRPNEITLADFPAERAPFAANHRLTVQPIVEGRAQAVSLSAHIAAAELGDGGVRMRIDPRDTDIARRWPSAASEGTWSIEGADRALQPPVLVKVRELEDFLAAQRDLGVGRVIGAWEQLATVNYIASNWNESLRTVPSDPRTLAESLENFERVRGARETSRTIEGSGRAVLVTALVRGANFVDTSELLRRVRAWEHEHLEPSGVRLELAGDIAVSQALVGGIVDSQVRSLWLGVVGIVVSLALVLRSVKLGVLCTLPTAFVVLASFAAMAVGGIAIGVATSMFAGMLLGVGVDYAVHLCVRMRAEAEQFPDTRDVVRETFLAVGPAVLVDVTAVGASFGLLAFSSVPANAHLGLLVLVGLATAFVATITLLPACSATVVRR